MQRRSGRPGERRTSWTQCAIGLSRASSGRYSGTIPVFEWSHVSPPSSVSQTPTDEIATSSFEGSPGHGAIVWRQSPPFPGLQSDRVG